MWGNTTGSPAWINDARPMILSKPQEWGFGENTRCVRERQIQRSARHCIINNWLNICQNNRHSTEIGNICTVYDVMNKSCDPSANKFAPLTSVSEETSSTILSSRWTLSWFMLRRKLDIALCQPFTRLLCATRQNNNDSYGIISEKNQPLRQNTH